MSFVKKRFIQIYKMAYSRFINSTWYTFWSSNDTIMRYRLPNRKIKFAQTFDICDFPSYHITYGELVKKGISKVVAEVKEFYSKEHQGQVWYGGGYQPTVFKAKNPTEDELVELAGYLREFMTDVDDHFKLKNFFLYEWYYPLRNKFLHP